MSKDDRITVPLSRQELADLMKAVSLALTIQGLAQRVGLGDEQFIVRVAALEQILVQTALERGWIEEEEDEAN